MAMKRPLPFSLALFAAPAALLAQPTINFINIPVIGDAVTIGRCSDPIDSVALNASAGAMQTWDFSGLTEFSEDQIVFVDPATTPFVADFPNSNLCGITWEGTHTYYVANTSVLESEGSTTLIGPPPEDTANYLMNIDRETVIELPYSHGDGFQDAYSGTFSAGGFQGTVDGTVDFVADGYGTLILPTGTYANTVRYRMDRVQNNTIFGLTTVTTSVQWAWISEEFRFWLLLMDIDLDGFGSSDQVWYDKSPIQVGPQGIGDLNGAAMSLYPSPAPTGSSVTITGMPELVNARVEVMDALGRKVLDSPVVRSTFSTAGLVPGHYVVRSRDASGLTMRTGRLVIE